MSKRRADGWWYSAWLPDGRLVVAFMTDADLLPKGQSQLQLLAGATSQTVHTRARTSGLSNERPLQWITAASEVLECSGGTGWLATGDAALSFDPLSSQGICRALQSGLLAARTIAAAPEATTPPCLTGRSRIDTVSIATCERARPTTASNVAGLIPCSGAAGVQGRRLCKKTVTTVRMHSHMSWRCPACHTPVPRLGRGSETPPRRPIPLSHLPS